MSGFGTTFRRRTRRYANGFHVYPESPEGRRSGEPGWPFGQCFARPVRRVWCAPRHSRRVGVVTTSVLTHRDGPGRTPESPATTLPEVSGSGRRAFFRGP